MIHFTKIHDVVKHVSFYFTDSHNRSKPFMDEEDDKALLT